LPVERKVRASQRLKARTRYLLWGRDPVAFVHDVFDWPDGQAPTGYQDEILDDSSRHDRLAVYGPHGLGKTSMGAWLILHMWATRDDVWDWKNPTTAGAWRQVTKYLWPEVHKWARRLRWDAIRHPPLRHGRDLLELSIKGLTGEAFGIACKDPSTIEGAHADELLYVYDEAKIIPAEVFDASEGAFSAGRARAFTFSTPGPPAGRFFEVCTRKPGYEAWRVRHVSADEAVAAGRMSAAWIEQMARQWGADSPRFLNRCLGQFAQSSADATIPLAWVEAAQLRWHELNDREEAGEPEAQVWGPMTHLGVDVADEGEDDTALARRFGHAIRDLRVFHEGDPHATSTRAQAAMEPWPGALAVVDGIGVGSGVVANLRAWGVSVESFIGSESAEGFKDRTGEWGFLNLRSVAWWYAREALEPPSPWALPPDDRLTGDLTGPKWKELSGGRHEARIQIEPKDVMRRRLKQEGLPARSPDLGDAVVMAMFADHLRFPASTNLADLLTHRIA
jgi:hypothetical protein